MTESFDLLIRGGLVATPNGIAPADVGVIGGRVAAIDGPCVTVAITALAPPSFINSAAGSTAWLSM